MSGEIWQFLLVGGVGVAIAVLWLFIIYLPRWTAEGEGDHTAKSTEAPTSTEDPEEGD
ncbi:MAG: hypothetical protein WA990_04025 [Rubrobacteraceae bacterium]